MNDRDRLSWQRVTAEPVLQPGKLNPPWDARGAGSCCVFAESDGYRMYYTGMNETGLCVCEAHADLARPHVWEGRGCRLKPPDGHPHLCKGVSYPWVIPRQGQSWLMYLAGWAEPRKDGQLPNTINLAVSHDEGRSWQLGRPSPLLAHDKRYDRLGIGSACIIPAEGGWRMYYTAISEYVPRPKGVAVPHDPLPRIGIGYADSDDGLHWRKPFDDYLVSPRWSGHEPFEYVVSKPCVIRDGRRWRMWVSSCGRGYRIRSLVSENGLDWRWVGSDADGELGLGAPGAFDDQQTCYPCVVPWGTGYRMWFTGNDFGRTGMGLAVAEALPLDPATA